MTSSCIIQCIMQLEINCKLTADLVENRVWLCREVAGLMDNDSELELRGSILLRVIVVRTTDDV